MRIVRNHSTWATTHPEPKYTLLPRQQPNNVLPVSTLSPSLITLIDLLSNLKSVKTAPSPTKESLPTILVDIAWVIEKIQNKEHKTKYDHLIL